MSLFGDITDSLGITQFGQKAAYKKQKGGIQALFAALQAQQGQDFLKAQLQGQNALATLKQGNKNALSQAAFAGNRARQGIQTGGQQNLSAATQSLASRGLYNTTALDAAKRGVMADTQRQLSGLDAAIAQVMGGLQASGAAAEAQQQDWLANLLQQQSGASTNLGLNKASYLFGNAAGTPFNMNSLAPGGAQQLAQYAAFLF